MYTFMCADYRRAMMDVLEKRGEQVSLSRVMGGGQRGGDHVLP